MPQFTLKLLNAMIIVSIPASYPGGSRLITWSSQQLS